MVLGIINAIGALLLWLLPGGWSMLMLPFGAVALVLFVVPPLRRLSTALLAPPPVISDEPSTLTDAPPI